MSLRWVLVRLADFKSELTKLDKRVDCHRDKPLQALLGYLHNYHTRLNSRLTHPSIYINTFNGVIMSIQSNLKQHARALVKNKKNTKWLIVELMKISKIDFSVEYTYYKLYRYGFGSARNIYEWMMELCDSKVLIFNGYRPDIVNGRIVGYEPIFGLIK